MDTLTFYAKWRLCLGCGICKSFADNTGVRLIDLPKEGIRPVIANCAQNDLDSVFRACPVSSKSVQVRPSSQGSYGHEIQVSFGPVLQILEGYASDPNIRWFGASGGVLTALSLFCVEHLGMAGVLHTSQDSVNPIQNRTRLSRTREEILAATGSRYSPASVCDSLDLIEKSPSPCAFIGRPVEIVALRKAQQLKPDFNNKVGVALSFFCAESPSTQGTINLLQAMRVDDKQIENLRYRGIGWPGHFSAQMRGEKEPCATMAYRQSWSFLQAYRPWSAHLWPDGTGELADISCGDPWYEQPNEVNPGSSLVVVRTHMGQRIVQAAIEADYLHLKPAEPWKLFKSQQGLISKKGAVWGRLLVMRMFGIPVPRYDGYHLFENWCQLPLSEKLRSTLGTARRIIQRKYWKPMEIDFSEAVATRKIAPGE